MGGGFGIVDYVVFVGTLAVSCLIGIFFAFVKKQKTTDQILVGNRDMHLFPVSFSLLATYMSAILILGVAGEIYAHGTIISESIIGALIFIPLSGVLFLPTLYNLKLTSAYEYLEHRFQCKTIRLLATATFIIQITLYTGIVLYAPALALKAILDVPIWVSVVLIGGCAGLYTSIGGIKAVVWTDAFQIFIMFAGMLAIIIQGSINVGGLSKAFEIADQHYRIEYLNFKIDPFLRHSTLNIFFGNGCGWLAAYGVSQATVQRYCGMSTLRRAFISVLLTAPMVAFTMTLAGLCGIVVFANYAGCDPLTIGAIEKKDQIAPYFVIDHLSSHAAGLVGLFVAALFSGSLSTVSSVLNSLAAVVWEDFLKNISQFTKLSRTSQGLVVKVIALVFTVITIMIGLVVGKLGGILTATLAINGSTAGPLMALFLLGIFFPFANKWGAAFGMLVGLAITFSISLGAIMYKITPVNLPFRTDECPVDILEANNVTSLVYAVSSNFTMDSTIITNNAPKYFTFSYMLYPLIGTLITLIVGIVVSLLTGPSELNKDNEKYIHPALIWLISKCKSTTRPANFELSSPDSYINNGNHHHNGNSIEKYIKKSFESQQQHNNRPISRNFNNPPINGYRT